MNTRLFIVILSVTLLVVSPSLVRSVILLVVSPLLDNNPVLPSGAVIAYYGNNIPTGWSLCDGANGTPDLTGRFIIGANEIHPAGNAGGSETIDLHHSHGLGTLAMNLPSQSSSATQDGGKLSRFGTANHYHQLTGAIDSALTTTNILPPFYALIYICKE